MNTPPDNVIPAQVATSSADGASVSPQKKKPRNSNLELYRVIVMLLIVAHHFVVNSGLMGELHAIPHEVTASGYAMILFGGWGKIGINCFVLITCYFMCKSRITLGKFVKLYLQIVLYALVIDLIFMYTGHIEINIKSIAAYFMHFLPVTGLYQNFVGCFLVFWLCIPFLNVLVQHLTKKQHALLTILLVVFFTILPFNPKYRVNLDYLEWFTVLYLMASFIRFYEADFSRISHKAWGWLMLASLLLASSSMLVPAWLWTVHVTNSLVPYYFVMDSNMIFAVVVSITSFMWFKDLKIKQSNIINTAGAATFGVLLIHANSNAMRLWLWNETVDVVGHYRSLSAPMMALYAVAVVLLIFTVCACIDTARQRWLEPHINPRVEALLSRGWKRISGKLQGAGADKANS